MSILFICQKRQRPDSGHIELRRVGTRGKAETPAGDGFYFENTEKGGDGPESIQAFINACLGEAYYDGTVSLLGSKSVQVIDAMYRSSKSSKQEDVEYSNASSKSVVNASRSIF